MLEADNELHHDSELEQYERRRWMDQRNDHMFLLDFAEGWERPQSRLALISAVAHARKHGL